MRVFTQASTMHSLFEVDTVKFPDGLTVFEMLSTVWKCISNPRLAEVSEKTVSGELRREFTLRIVFLRWNNAYRGAISGLLSKLI